VTQEETLEPRHEFRRVLSQVPGLDAILHGGFLQGGVYLILGEPGAGKTILASQIMYNNVSKSEHAMLVTVLGESHGRMMAHLRTMRFFDEAATPDRVTYISGYQALENEGLKGLSVLIRREVLVYKVKILVLDDVSAVAAKSGDRYEMKRFTHEMQTLASAANCTMFMLTTVSGPMAGVENTMVDGLIELRHRSYGSRNERRLIVHKLRGGGYCEGEHAFRITSEGFKIFARLESLPPTPLKVGSYPALRKSFGVASVDAMFGGGLAEGSVTTLFGGSGTGKTTLGLHFLAASSAEEPGLLFGCYETPAHLRQKASAMGIDVLDAEKRGAISFLWNPIGEYVLDELAHRLLETVRGLGIKRLVIDGMSIFQQAAVEPERITRFWSALTSELRTLGVTTVQTSELQELAGPVVRIRLGEIPSLSETMILMRYVELRSRLYRLISLLKVRDGMFDPTIREFTINDSGIVVGDCFRGVEAVLSGTARTVSTAMTTPPEDREQGARADISTLLE
jgi:circadian clock protein KaiC